MLYHNLLDCDRQLTVCGTNVLLVERIIPTGIMARSKMTVHNWQMARIDIAIRRSLLPGATPCSRVGPNELIVLLYALVFKRNGITQCPN